MAKEETKSTVGQIGEELAARFLEGKGYRVIARNYRKPWGEIDIIASLGHSLRFVEVKTVSRENLLPTEYRAEDNVHPAKIKRIHRALQSYLDEKDITGDSDWQIDLVTVTLIEEKKQAKVEFFEAIF